MAEEAQSLIDLASLAAEATFYVFVVVNWWKIFRPNAPAWIPSLVGFISALVVVFLLLLHKGYITGQETALEILQIIAGDILVSLLVMGASAGTQKLSNSAEGFWKQDRDGSV